MILMLRKTGFLISGWEINEIILGDRIIFGPSNFYIKLSYFGT